MDNINIIDFLFNIFNVIIDGGRAVWSVLSYQIPLNGLLNVVAKIVDFFGGSLDLSQLQDASISVMTIAGVALGVIIIIVIIKKIIPFF